MIPKKILLIIASQGYQPLEYTVPKKIIQSFGHEVFTASDNSGTAVAKDNTRAKIDYQLEDVDPTQFDGIFIIGGPGAMEHLDKPVTYKIMQQIAKLKRPYGAICVSPRILAKAGVLNDKQATGWNDDGELDAIFEQHNVTYIKSPVVVDGSVITAVNPHAAQAFGDAIVKALR